MSRSRCHCRLGPYLLIILRFFDGNGSRLEPFSTEWPGLRGLILILTREKGVDILQPASTRRARKTQRRIVDYSGRDASRCPCKRPCCPDETGAPDKARPLSRDSTSTSPRWRAERTRWYRGQRIFARESQLARFLVEIHRYRIPGSDLPAR